MQDAAGRKQAVDHSKQVAAVLQLVVQHCPDLSYKDKDICNLLAPNSACRTAVQQSVGHMTVEVGSQDAIRHQRLAAFAAWFVKHASLVDRLTLTPGGDLAAAAEQLMLFALQNAAAAPLLALGAAHRAAAGDTRMSSLSPQQQQLAQQDRQQPAPLVLQLGYFSSSAVVSAPLLAALAASTRLTHLAFKVNTAPVTSSWCDSLARLTSLRKLELSMPASTTTVVPDDSLVRALGRLSQLASLTFDLMDLTPEHYQLLPPSLQRLGVRSFNVRGVVVVAQPGIFRLEHLSSLQKLALSNPSSMASGPVLPASITSLALGPGAKQSKGAQALQELRLSGAGVSAQLWEQLPCMTNLQTLTLDSLTRVHRARDLQRYVESLATATQLRRVILAASTFLRKPSGACYVQLAQIPQPSIPLDGLQLHKHLQKLHRLESLFIEGLDVQPQDAMHLTCLTGLTALQLLHCTALGDLATVSLACRLTGLQKLVLVGCGLTSPMLWPVLAQLTGLESLTVLRGTPELIDDTLHLLAPLTKLSCFTLDSSAFKVSAVERDRFLHGMPFLSRMQTKNLRNAAAV